MDPTRRPRARLPEPELFSGVRAKWPTWRITIQNKLSLDGLAIGDEFDQAKYLFARLEGEASRNVATYLKAHAEARPNQLLDYLETIYADPNAEQRAVTRLQSMKQGKNEPFARFLTKFQKELTESGAAVL